MLAVCFDSQMIFSALVSLALMCAGVGLFIVLAIQFSSD